MIALLYIIVMLAAALTWSESRGIAPGGGGDWRRRVDDVLSRACDAGSQRLLAATRTVTGSLRSALGATLARPAPVRWRPVPWRWAATPSLRWAESRGAWAVAWADAMSVNCVDVGPSPPGRGRTSSSETVLAQASWAAPGRYSF